jgi:ankyrin repeat protein
VVDYLVDKMEYDVNQQTPDGKTALQIALENNQLNVVKVLLSLQTTVNEEDKKTLDEIDDEEIHELLHQHRIGIGQDTSSTALRRVQSKTKFILKLYFLN